MPVMPVSVMDPVWQQFSALLPVYPEVSPTHPLGCHRPIRRRVRAWSDAGLATELHALAITQYDRMIGLDLDDIAVGGCITKAPCGGEKAG